MTATRKDFPSPPPDVAQTPERLRALSDGHPLADWPPELGRSVHLNTGSALTSWTGEVRALVDAEVAVIIRRAVGIHPPGLKEGHYVLMTRADWEKRATPIRYGALPHPLRKVAP